MKFNVIMMGFAKMGNVIALRQVNPMIFGDLTWVHFTTLASRVRITTLPKLDFSKTGSLESRLTLKHVKVSDCAPLHIFQDTMVTIVIS